MRAHGAYSSFCLPACTTGSGIPAPRTARSGRLRLGGRLGLVLIDRARGQVTRGATFRGPAPSGFPGRGWAEPGAEGDRSLQENKVAGPGPRAQDARAARLLIRPAGSTALRLGCLCRKKRAPSRVAGRPSSAPPSLSNKGAGGGRGRTGRRSRSSEQLSRTKLWSRPSPEEGSGQRRARDFSRPGPRRNLGLPQRI